MCVYIYIYKTKNYIQCMWYLPLIDVTLSSHFYLPSCSVCGFLLTHFSEWVFGTMLTLEATTSPEFARADMNLGRVWHLSLGLLSWIPDPQKPPLCQSCHEAWVKGRNRLESWGPSCWLAFLHMCISLHCCIAWSWRDMVWVVLDVFYCCCKYLN